VSDAQIDNAHSIDELNRLLASSDLVNTCLYKLHLQSQFEAWYAMLSALNALLGHGEIQYVRSTVDEPTGTVDAAVLTADLIVHARAVLGEDPRFIGAEIVSRRALRLLDITAVARPNNQGDRRAFTAHAHYEGLAEPIRFAPHSQYEPDAPLLEVIDALRTDLRR